MRTFIYQDAKSHKFWNITCTGTTFTVEYGRVGSKGQSQTKSFADEAAARSEAEKLIADKVKKGYRETTAPTGTAGLRRALEEAINENPEEVANYAAYADVLQDAGDPQGEFIQVQLALEDAQLSARERKDLTAREATLLAEHGATWTGEWATLAVNEGPTGRGQHEFPDPKPARFIRGVLAQATIGNLTVECARAFAANPETRLVRRLFLGGLGYDDATGDDEPALSHFLTWPGLANLRVFQFGWTSIEEYGDFCSHQCHQRGDEIHGLIERMARLEELYLFADEVDLEALFRLKTFTNLRVLQVYHNWDYPLELLARNRALTNLTHLLLHPKALGTWSDSPVYITNEGVKSLLNSKYLGNLTHLRLRLTRLGDEGCEMIVNSGILKRLRMLDLRHGCIGDEGARLLAACPDLRNLELLDLSRNQLTPEGISLLQATGVPLRHEYQHEPFDNDDADDEDPPEFLMEGDYE